MFNEVHGDNFWDWIPAERWAFIVTQFQYASRVGTTFTPAATQYFDNE